MTDEHEGYEEADELLKSVSDDIAEGQGNIEIVGAIESLAEASPHLFLDFQFITSVLVEVVADAIEHLRDCPNHDGSMDDKMATLVVQTSLLTCYEELRRILHGAEAEQQVLGVAEELFAIGLLDADADGGPQMWNPPA